MSRAAHGDYYEVPAPFFPTILSLDFSPNVSNLVVLITLLLPFYVFAVDTFFQSVFASDDPVGCSKLGLDLTSRSGLADQYASKSAKAKSDSKWQVKALFIYPIKSCAPVELAKSEVSKTGLRFDRVFSFAQRMVDDVKGQAAGGWSFITLRDYPRLAHVTSQVWLQDLSKPMGKSSSAKAGWLVVRFPAPVRLNKSTSTPTGLFNSLTVALSKAIGINVSPVPTREFRVPLEPDSEWIRKNGLPTRPLNTWRETPHAVELSTMIDTDVLEDLRAFLGVKRPLTLFRTMGSKEQEDFRVSPKADVGYQPVHGPTEPESLSINNLASVRRIGSLLDPSIGNLDAQRFRANIYVTGPEVYEEDTFKRLRIGTHNFAITAKTKQRTLPVIEDNVLGQGEDPKFHENSANGHAAAKSRQAIDLHKVADPNSPKKPVLGMEMAPERYTGLVGSPMSWWVSVGDEVEVLQRGQWDD